MDMSKQGKGTADHLLPLGDWFSDISSVIVPLLITLLVILHQKNIQKFEKIQGNFDDYPHAQKIFIVSFHIFHISSLARIKFQLHGKGEKRGHNYLFLQGAVFQDRKCFAVFP